MRISTTGHDQGSAMTVFTVGHSTRSVEQLIGLLQEAAVDWLVDVRSIPRSRTNPQFNADVLPAALAPAGIGYRHLPALGGLRGRRARAAPSPNTLWRNASFRSYADHAMSPEFREGLKTLQQLARDRTCAIMCAEAVWWRCHRRIIADYLLTSGSEVRHILGVGRIGAARVTPEAKLQPDGTLIYPAPQSALSTSSKLIRGVLR